MPSHADIHGAAGRRGGLVCEDDKSASGIVQVLSITLREKRDMTNTGDVRNLCTYKSSHTGFSGE